jgi:hypothetical protein
VHKVVLAVMTLPPALTFVGWLALLAIAGITGRHPIWSLAPENLPEAAAFRDPVAVVRHLARGENIDRAERVRAGIVQPDAANLTPIEAAAAAQDESMVQMMFNLGAAPEPMVWQRAWCISDSAAVRNALERRRPSGADPALCRE